MKTPHLAKKMMGKLSSIPKMDTKPIQKALGDKMPQIDPTPLGRFRLVSALKNQFGSSYKNHPVAASALSHFDSEAHFFQTLIKTRNGK